MNFFLKIVFTLLIFFSLQNTSFAKQIIKFANVDLIIRETNLGNQMLNKITNLDKQNIELLTSFEKEIQKTQNEIQLKKNVISELEIQKKVEKLKKQMSDFNNKKKNMVGELTNIQNKELNLFFEKIKPIVQDYMNDNSIDLIFNSKNIFIGNKNSDITQELITHINNNF